MLELKGKYNTAKIFTDVVESGALDQIREVCDSELYKNSQIRIMPDSHKGNGICIGYTATLEEWINPNFVGVDISCAMTGYPLGNIDIDYQKLDDFIRKNVPHGMYVHEGFSFSKLEQVLKTFSDDKQFFDKVELIADKVGAKSRVFQALGTLGGGNHFLSVNQDTAGNKYFVMHSGSRNFGKCIAEYHEEQANISIQKEDYDKEINRIKTVTSRKEIGKEIQKFKDSLKSKKGIGALSGIAKEEYFHDMKIAQTYAALNRRIVLNKIAEFFGVKYSEENIIESVHNYIDFSGSIPIIRKGATSAKSGEKVLIPISMADGIIFGIGKGNKDWNESAPHGAGRLMSRSKAKQNITLEEYQTRMNESGVWSSCISENTLDESPQAYKNMDDIINNISDTVDIKEVWQEKYNFKDS